MKVHIPICPNTGFSPGVCVNGELELSEDKPKVISMVSSASSSLSSQQLASYCLMQGVSVLVWFLKMYFFALKLLFKVLVHKVKPSKEFLQSFPKWSATPFPKKEGSFASTADKTKVFAEGGLSAAGDTMILGSTSQRILNRAECVTMHHAIDGPKGKKLKLILFPNEQKVQRVVAVPYVNARERVSFSYHSISDILPNQFGLNFQFCFQAVVSICEKDIAAGLFEKYKSEKPSMGLGLHSSDADQPTPKVAASNFVAPVQAQVSHETKSPIEAPIKHAVGVVSKLGTVSKKYGDKPAYDIFEVVVNQANGESMSFVGQQLQEKSLAGEFKLGDRVDIAQGKVQMQKTSKDGNVFNTNMNVFNVTVL